MTSESVPEQRAARRPRRAVRTAGTVGTDDSVLVWMHPAIPAQVPASPPAATPARGTEQPADPAVATRSADDSDLGWGGGADSNDDRLRQDKPPHW